MPIQNSFHFSIQLKPSFPSTLQRLRPYGLYGSATCKSILNNFFLRIFQHIDLSAEVHLAGPRVKILERSILIGNFYIKGLRTLLIKGTLLPKTTFHFQKKMLLSFKWYCCLPKLGHFATLFGSPMYSLLPVSTDNVYKCNWLVFAKTNYKRSLWYFITLMMEKTGLGPLIPSAIAWRKYGWFSS